MYLFCLSYVDVIWVQLCHFLEDGWVIGPLKSLCDLRVLGIGDGYVEELLDARKIVQNGLTDDELKELVELLESIEYELSVVCSLVSLPQAVSCAREV